MSQSRTVTAVAPRFKLAEHERNIFQYQAAEGTTIEQITDPAYWAHVAGKLNPLDRIEIITDDYSMYAELIVLDKGTNWAKVKVIREPISLSSSGDVDIEEAESPFEIKFTGPHTKHAVIRKSDKSVMKNGFATKDQANKWVTEYRRSLAA